MNTEGKSLVGMFVHTFKDVRDANGAAAKAMQFQGRVIGRDGSDMLIQLYSWGDGRETCVALLPIESLRYPYAQFYTTEKAWAAEASK